MNSPKATKEDHTIVAARLPLVGREMELGRFWRVRGYSCPACGLPKCGGGLCCMVQQREGGIFHCLREQTDKVASTARRPVRMR